MFVILAYDIGAKRVAKVRKTVIRYLHPVQRSVFQGFLTEHSLKKLQRDLQGLIKCEEDAIIIYRMESLQGIARDEIGKRLFSGEIII